MSGEKSPEGILCVAKYIDILHKRVKIYNNVSDVREETGMHKNYFIVSSCDPGNLGTIVQMRMLSALMSCIFWHCADIYNPRTVRAAMGALFRQKITVCRDIISAVSVLREMGYCVLAAALSQSSVSITNVDVSCRTCFLIAKWRARS